MSCITSTKFQNGMLNPPCPKKLGHYDPSKCPQLFTSLQGVTTQKTVIFTLTAVGTPTVALLKEYLCNLVVCRRLEIKHVERN